MSKYVCCQGYVNCCCFKAGSLGEESCPDICLCLEACLCNGCAVSASRLYVMDKYNLTSDPCDYRIIRFSNFIQLLACVCNILAIFIDELRQIAWILDRFADLVYHIVSGCMTAQVRFVILCFQLSLLTQIIFYVDIVRSGLPKQSRPPGWKRILGSCRGSSIQPSPNEGTS